MYQMLILKKETLIISKTKCHMGAVYGPKKLSKKPRKKDFA